MANVLTRLIPDLYAAMNVVSREITGFIPSVVLDARASAAALNQDVVIPVVPSTSATDTTAAATVPASSDTTMENTTIRITKSRHAKFHWTGEEILGLSTGVGVLTLQQDQIAQAMRTLINEMEIDLGLLYKRSSRAYGTAGTNPFATDQTPLAQMRKILTDNGAPLSDLRCVVDTSAGASLRSVPNLYKVNEGGDRNLLTQGVISDLYGFKIRESAGVAMHTKGTSASHQLNGAHAANATTINVDTGTGTIVAGDVLSIANGSPIADTNKYVVGTALSAGALSIGAPGLRLAHADNDAVTLANNYTANMCFSRSAMVLACRPPAIGPMGDLATDRMYLSDPVTGITFEIAYYPGFRQGTFFIGLAWGCANIKPEHTATLLG